MLRQNTGNDFSYYKTNTLDQFRTALTDITDRVVATHKLHESEERFRLALQGTHDGLWDWDLTTQQVYYSPRYAEMLGYKPDKFSNSPDGLTALLHPKEKELVLSRFSQHLAGNGIHYNITKRMRHQNGGWRWILCRSLTLRNEQGKALRVIGAHTDVTETKRLERQLVRARNEAQAASQAKSEFLANMSHEIRTPLNAIVGVGHILQQEESLDERQRSYVSTLCSGAESLMSLINELLDIAKIENNSVELENIPFNIISLLQEAADVSRVKADEKGLTLELQDEVTNGEWYLGDPMRINQIVLNLLSNAIKFTDSGSIILRSETWPNDLGTPDLAISVIDNGIGIPLEKQKDIFDMFTQADASITRRFGGTGLGLAICRKLAERMGGRIDLSSLPGKGSTFTLIVPLEAANIANTYAAPAEDTKEHPPAGRYGRILLVEDHHPNILIASTLLEGFGYRYDIAYNGEQALECLSRNTYSLVLMDVQMPGMDGFETTRILRSRESQGKRIPIIAMTAHALSGDRKRCLQAGMDDYILNRSTQTS